MRWLVLPIAVAACASPVEGPGVEQDPRPLTAAVASRPYRDFLDVTAWPRDQADVEEIWQLAEHVLKPHDRGLVTHELVILPATLERLRSAGIPLRVEPIDVQAMIDDSYAEPPSNRPHASATFGSFFDRVQQLDALHAYLDELAAASQGRARVVTLGKSIQNRDIKAIRVSSASEDNARPTAIVTGTQHAREWASPMVTTGLADALVRQYDSDPRVRRIVDTLEIFIVTVTNPDGYVASHAGLRLQRKNMNPKCNVDLNRNWGEWWGLGVPRNSCGAETFPGDGAFSEPETLAVSQLAQSRTALRFYVDYHSCAQQVMYPMCFEQTAPAGQAEDKAWTELYSETFRGVHGGSLPSQPCFGIGGGEGGCSHDWFRKRIPNVMEVELPPGGAPSGFGIADAQVVSFVEENWEAWLAVLTKVAEKIAVDGGVPPLARDAGADAKRDGATTSDAGREDGAVTAVDGGTETGGPADGAGIEGSGAGGGPGSGAAGAAGFAGARAGTQGGSTPSAGGTSSGSANQVGTAAESGCSCRVGARPRERSAWALALLIAGGALSRSRRMSREPRCRAGAPRGS